MKTKTTRKSNPAAGTIRTFVLRIPRNTEAMDRAMLDEAINQQMRAMHGRGCESNLKQEHADRLPSAAAQSATPRQAGVMERSADLLSRTRILAARFETVLSALHRDKGEGVTQGPNPPDADLLAIHSEHNVYLARLEFLAGAIEHQIGI